MIATDAPPNVGTSYAGYVTDTAGTVTVNYLHHDHLGSIDTVTDGDGNVVERLSYDPHGKRRNGTSWADAATAVEPLAGHRGYTGHEHLDDVGLIHMNGRVYDPTLGRFLSADPTIPHPGNLQSFNRYSYVRNNPLTLVDPTGFGECNPRCDTVIVTPDDDGGQPGGDDANGGGMVCLGVCFFSDSSGTDDGLSNGPGGGSSDAEKKAEAERRRVAASQRASRRSQRSINQNQQAANRAERSNFKSPDKTSVASNNAWTVGERLGYWKWEAGRTADDLLEVLDRNGALSATTWPARGAIEGVSEGSISDVVREIVMAAPMLRAESAVAKGLADPSAIRFTQSSISASFKDGRTVQETIDALRSGKLSPNDLPPIRIFEKDGFTYTLDNRRLFSAGQAGVGIKTIPATPEEVAKESWKFTTPNNGTIICVKGGCVQ